ATISWPSLAYSGRLASLMPAHPLLRLIWGKRLVRSAMPKGIWIVKAGDTSPRKMFFTRSRGLSSVWVQLVWLMVVGLMLAVNCKILLKPVSPIVCEAVGAGLFPQARYGGLSSVVSYDTRAISTYFWLWPKYWSIRYV